MIGVGPEGRGRVFRFAAANYDAAESEIVALARQNRVGLRDGEPIHHAVTGGSGLVLTDYLFRRRARPNEAAASPSTPTVAGSGTIITVMSSR